LLGQVFKGEWNGNIIESTPTELSDIAKLLQGSGQDESSSSTPGLCFFVKASAPAPPQLPLGDQISHFSFEFFVHFFFHAHSLDTLIPALFRSLALRLSEFPFFVLGWLLLIDSSILLSSLVFSLFVSNSCVLPPFSTRDTLSRIQVEVLDRYIMIANHLEKSPLVVDLLERIKEPMDEPPFIAVDGSSGIGKTQLYFCLAAALKEETAVPVSYLPLSPLAQTPQHLYTIYAFISSEFQTCVKQDLAQFCVAQPSVHLLRGAYALLLKTAAFLASMFLGGAHKPMTWRDLKRRLSDASVRPILFLDEVPSKNKSDSVGGIISLTTNLCCIVGIRAILSGTDSTALNYSSGGENSRGDFPISMWARFVIRLPKVPVSLRSKTCALLSAEPKN
jgi:hypothetical protein